MEPAETNGAGRGLIRIADSEALSSEDQVIELELEVHVDADVSVWNVAEQVFLVLDPEQGFRGGEEVPVVAEAVFHVWQGYNSMDAFHYDPLGDLFTGGM